MAPGVSTLRLAVTIALSRLVFAGPGMRPGRESFSQYGSSSSRLVPGLGCLIREAKRLLPLCGDYREPR